MTDLIEKIGPIVGVVAFLGLAILAFLIFQQAREVRRLREWAGRAPERAAEAAEATAAAAEARGEAPAPAAEKSAEPAAAGASGPVGQWWARMRERAAPTWAEIDRRSPVDPRYFVVVIAAAIVAAGVLTSGFGIVGGDDEPAGRGGGGQGQRANQPDRVEVTVLNATQEQDVNGELIPGVPGLADDVAKQVVRPAGFAIGRKDDAPSGFERTTIFFESGSEDAATRLAEEVAPQLGEPEVEPMIGEVEAAGGGAPLVLVIGQDDADALGEPAA